MRAFLILCALFACSACAAKPGPEHDPKAVIGAVIDYLPDAPIHAWLRRPERKVCINLDLWGVGLDQNRWLFETRRPRKTYSLNGVESVVPPSHWYWLYPDGKGEISGALQERLTLSAHRITGAESQIIGPRRLSARWVDHGFSTTTNSIFKIDEYNRECDVIRLSAPSFSDDFAFVEVGYSCGGCGTGDIVVVERKNRRWEVVAVQPLYSV